jgi:glycosyltransferase involved in cell wall biosynthesis
LNFRVCEHICGVVEQKMKIAILGTRGIPARYGGFETFAEQLAIRLTVIGHDVTVMCEAKPNSETDYKGIKVVHLRTLAWGPLRTIIFDAECLWKSRKGYDVVYMLGYGASFLCWIPRLWGTRVWINMDGLEWTRAKWSRAGRTYLHLMEAVAMFTADRLIADARAIRENLRIRHLYARHKTCDVIPYGCEIISDPPGKNLIAEWNLTERQYYLIVCRFEPENNVREMIEGHRRSGTRVPLLLVGDRSTDTAYVREILKCEGSLVRFVGTVFDERIKALRYYSKAYFHGHSVGGTNPSLLEAMGCENLVLAHDNVFTREVLGQGGLFFDGPQSLARLITDVEAGTVGEGELRRECVVRAGQFYSWSRIVSAYDELLVRNGQIDAERDLAPPPQASSIPIPTLAMRSKMPSFPPNA